MRAFLFIISFLAVTIALAQTPATIAFTKMQSDYSRTLFANPLAMTITQILAGPKELKFKQGKVSILADRKQTAILAKAGTAGFTYVLQKDRTAPLAFVLPGTGGTANSQSAAFLGEQLYGLGYQIVIVDNAFSWKFAVSSSTTGVPGYAPRDAKDVERVMKAVSAKLATEFNVRPRAYALVGSSLGGLLALHIHKIDTQFHFTKVMAINPPLDMVYAVNQIDSLFAQGAGFTEGYKGQLMNRIVDVAQELLTDGQDLQDRAFMQRAFEDLKLEDSDMAYLIGMTFHNSLRDVLYASQQVNDTGLLKIPATRFRQNARLAEAYGFSFNDYMTQLVLPSVRAEKSANYTIEKMNQEASIYQFASDIKTSKNLYVIHSADDFLLKKGDAAWMTEQFGDRALIFPYGGHCGSMNFDEFKAQLKSVFSF